MAGIIATADLKTWLGINDSNDDTTLATAVAAANKAVTTYCGRTFDKVASGSETARVYRPTGGAVLLTHDFWTSTNLVVKTDDGDTGTFSTTWAATDYELEPLNGLDGSLAVPYWRLRAVNTRYWPSCHTRASVQITAAWGWTAVPGDVTEAALIKAARLWKRKDSPEGVLGGFAEMGAVRVTNREDPDVVSLLRPYRRLDTLALVG